MEQIYKYCVLYNSLYLNFSIKFSFLHLQLVIYCKTPHYIAINGLAAKMREFNYGG